MVVVTGSASEGLGHFLGVGEGKCKGEDLHSLDLQRLASLCYFIVHTSFMF